jgi:hypothetical protein
MSDISIGIEKIVVRIKDVTLELTPEEFRELRATMDVFDPKPQVFPYYVPAWYPQWQTLEYPKRTWITVTSDGTKQINSNSISFSDNVASSLSNALDNGYIPS